MIKLTQGTHTIHRQTFDGRTQVGRLCLRYERTAWRLDDLELLQLVAEADRLHHAKLNPPTTHTVGERVKEWERRGDDAWIAALSKIDARLSELGFAGARVQIEWSCLGKGSGDGRGTVTDADKGDAVKRHIVERLEGEK